jgi:hypothetical protein
VLIEKGGTVVEIWRGGHYMNFCFWTSLDIIYTFGCNMSEKNNTFDGWHRRFLSFSFSLRGVVLWGAR